MLKGGIQILPILGVGHTDIIFTPPRVGSFRRQAVNTGIYHGKYGLSETGFFCLKW